MARGGGTINMALLTELFTDRSPAASLLRSFGLRGLLGLFPRALGSFGDQTLLEGIGGHADVAHLAVDDGFDALEVREEAALGDRRDVRADTAALLRFTTTPDDAAFHWAFASQFTKSSHKNAF